MATGETVQNMEIDEEVRPGITNRCKAFAKRKKCIIFIAITIIIVAFIAIILTVEKNKLQKNQDSNDNAEYTGTVSE